MGSGGPEDERPLSDAAEGGAMTPEEDEHADSPSAVSLAAMLDALQQDTGVDFAAGETTYGSYAARAQLAVQELEFHDRLVEIHERLSAERVAGTIRAIESWSSGENEFRIVTKSWPSLVDKLYRINHEENPLYSQPPIVPTIEERARKLDAERQRWIVPGLAHEVVDDLLRTKFVVPFVDGVVEVGEQITAAMNEFGLMRFVRFHAKDTGYHARHYYALLTVQCGGEVFGGEVVSGETAAAEAGVPAAEDVEIVVKTRPAPGKDMGISRTILEKLRGRTISVTHQVIYETTQGGWIIHQHTEFVGKYGGLLEVPEWARFPRIP